MEGHAQVARCNERNEQASTRRNVPRRLFIGAQGRKIAPECALGIPAVRSFDYNAPLEQKPCAA